MENKIWNLFKLTGDIRCFNLLREIEGSKNYANGKNRRNHSRRNEL